MAASTRCAVLLSCVPSVRQAYYLVQRWYRHTSRELKRLESVSRSPVYEHFSDTLAGGVTVRAAQAQGRFLREGAARVRVWQRASYTLSAAGTWLGFCVQCMGACITSAVAISAIVQCPPGRNGVGSTLKPQRGGGHSHTDVRAPRGHTTAGTNTLVSAGYALQTLQTS